MHSKHLDFIKTYLFDVIEISRREWMICALCLNVPIYSTLFDSKN